MNNATRESSCHPVPVPHNNHKDDPGQSTPEEQFNQVEQKAISEVLHCLDQIRYTPRAATIRAIMKYAHEKKEAIH